MSWKKDLGIIVFLVVYAVMIRFYHLTAPLNDRHHFRQTDTYAIVSNFSEGSSDILHPKFYQTPNPSNTEGLYFGEFPIYQYLIYLMFMVTGESLILARLFTIGLSAFTTVGIFAIGKVLFNRKIGFAAALAFTLFPSSVFWGRAISPDVMALTFFTLSTACIFSGDRTVNKVLGALFWTGAVLIKPYYLAFGLLYAFYFFLEQRDEVQRFSQQRITRTVRKIIFFSLPAILLYGAWRIWAATFDPSTIDPDPASILHDRQGWWQYWHTSDWIALLFSRHFYGELLTPLGGILATAGAILLISKHNLVRGLLIIWLICNFLISITFAWGSWQHDYYLLPWLPVLSLLTGYATVEVVNYFKKLWTERLDQFEYLWRIGLLVVVMFFVYFLGIKKFFDYRDDFFRPQGYELFAQDFEYDYQKMADIVPQSETVVSIQKYYSPYAVNKIKRRGNIVAIPETETCPSDLDLFNDIEKLHRLKANYLMIHKTGDPLAACSRERLNTSILTRYELLYQGKEFDLYQITAPQLFVSGTRDQLILTTTNMGDDNTLEVGGIPGSVNTVEIYPDWQLVEEGTYRAVVDSSTWLSFKIYWKTPDVTLNTNEWFIDKNNFIVKR